MLLVRAAYSLRSFGLSRDGARIHIQFDRGESLKKGSNDIRIDRRSGYALANRHAVLLAQVVAEIAGRLLVLHQQFMAALAAINEAMQ